MKCHHPLRLAVLAALCAAGAGSTASAQSVARSWNDQILDAIRIDFPNPTVHARNLFHLSVGMWDAWAAYDQGSAVACVYREDATAADIAAARHEAISYAAYRILSARYARSTNAATTLNQLRNHMIALGYAPNNTSTEGALPSAVGNRVGAMILDFASTDGSNESINYRDFTYFPVNSPLIIFRPSTVMAQPNRWQPLAFDVAFTQNGQIADDVQTFLGSHWGDVTPFAMRLEPGETLYHDPGQPPQLGGEADTAFKDGNLEVIRYSARLDPDSGDMIDISPGAYGNSPLGENGGTGHERNPFTDAAYAPNVVKHGDFGRVLAEFWADGPDSETPPGHWNALANEVVEHPEFERRWQGEGEIVDALEWDVKMYLALNGALHDAAVTAWGCKRVYDYVRPISSIRYLASRGQSSDPSLPNYRTNGIPLEPGLVELITADSTVPGERHEHLSGDVGKIALRCWVGEPNDPENEFSGVGWIAAESWLPYQRDTFVTPAFAGYVSGHSTFSRAAAEVLTRLTGSAFFPGGMGTFTAKKDDYLEFELGPTTDVVLQWATYYDAADQAGISRLYGGIHVPADDGPGRIMGAECGIDAWERALTYFNGTVGAIATSADGSLSSEDRVKIACETIPGLFYQVQTSTNTVDYQNYEDPVLAREHRTDFTVDVPGGVPDQFFVKVLQTVTP